jgi:hypothetical protein
MLLVGSDSFVCVVAAFSANIILTNFDDSIENYKSLIEREKLIERERESERERKKNENFDHKTNMIYWNCAPTTILTI